MAISEFKHFPGPLMPNLKTFKHQICFEGLFRNMETPLPPLPPPPPPIVLLVLLLLLPLLLLLLLMFNKHYRLIIPESIQIRPRFPKVDLWEPSTEDFGTGWRPILYLTTSIKELKGYIQQ